jgi:predicted component of type VI protein secretion system
MKLILEILNAEKHALPMNEQKIFTSEGGTIGRAPDCTWVIPDAARHLSGHHASIVLIEGQFAIRDTSTNGVFINGAEYPLGREMIHTLHEGDLMQLGVFKVCVKSLDKRLFSDTATARVVENKEAENASLTALLDAAGLSRSDYDKYDDVLLPLIGAVFKESISGLQATLNATSALKNELRFEVAALQTEQENSLSLQLHYEQAVRHALEKKQGDLILSQAVKEGFQTLQNHQMGLMVGIKAALETLMLTLDPSEVEKKAGLQTRNWLRFMRPFLWLFTRKKSRCWARYQQAYAELMMDGDVFQRFFCEPFEKAYQEYLQTRKRNRME